MASKSLAARDEALALSTVREKMKKPGRKHRCGNCGLLYTDDEIQRDFDQDGRRLGWICEGCW